MLKTAALIKAANPSATVGIYWRANFALELAQCSGFREEWAARALEYTFKMEAATPPPPRRTTSTSSTTRTPPPRRCSCAPR